MGSFVTSRKGGRPAIGKQAMTTLERQRPHRHMPTCSARHTIALTRRQRELFKEAEAVAALTKLNYHMIEEADPKARILLLRIAINNMVIAETVTRYTFLDEILSDLIACYFFKLPKGQLHFGKLWRTKKFQTFAHHILDEMYLLKKMALVHAIDPVPSGVRKTIEKVNALRNAFAHSFFPENRKEHCKNKKVLYNGKGHPHP
jgi:hypothetical protein